MSEQPEALRLARILRDSAETINGVAFELENMHALCVEQIKMIERINYLCADTVRTNSKDTRDWLEDVAFISRITAGHLAKWKESR